MGNETEYAYLTQPLGDYLDRLAARTPCPGGGSVAALVACLAAALASMAAVFTAGKKAYAAHEARLRALLDESANLRAELQKFIEEDSRIYARMRAAARTDPAVEQKAVRASIEMHCEVASAMLKVLQWDRFLLESGNPRLVSDVGISAVLAEAAFWAARFNAEINFTACADPAFTEQRRMVLDRLEREIIREAATVRQGSLTATQGGTHAGTDHSGK